jgi:xanthine dehydrogenase YagR molybdenum-binding subunit
VSLGLPLIRKDGLAKVTGAAKYALDHYPPGLLHAVVVQSVIAAGRIRSIESAAVAIMPGVVRLFTHHDFPRLSRGTLFPYGSLSQSLLPLQDEVIRFNGQPVALVVAETWHAATEAARHVSVSYDVGAAAADIDDPAAIVLAPEDTRAPPWIKLDSIRGEPETALAAAPVRVEASYSTPRHQHCPIEPHGTVAMWTEGEGFTVWEPAQWAEGARAAIAEWLAEPIERVRVISPYVGGGFGCKVEPHPHVAMACAAARALGRPVKLALTRPQNFTAHGARPATRQTVRIGAERDGRITAVIHECVNDSSGDDHFIEPAGAITKFTYAIPNLHVRQRLVAVSSVTPTTLRAPGYSVGAFALESAVDELAYALALDPVELRLRNWATVDPETGKPWSTCRLREAYAAGAEAFGWFRRDPRPSAMRDGRELVGWGMAVGGYPVYITPAEVRIRVEADGHVEVATSGADLGTGTYTIVAQTVAEALGVPVDRIDVRLGDTALPPAPITAGSQLAATLTSAARKTALAAHDALLALAAGDPASPAHRLRANDLSIVEGHIVAAGRRIVDVADLLRLAGRPDLTVTENTLPAGKDSAADRHATFRTAMRTVPPSADHAVYSWCAQFAEIRIDEDLGTLRVSRLVGAFDCGRLYNPTLAKSQWEGGMIMGLGAALLEGLDIDRRYGRIMNNNLADYLLPVAADMPAIEVISVGEPDTIASPLGGKSVGEIGIIGTAAAIANAVFHATGRRVRDLPIRIESLI